MTDQIHPDRALEARISVSFSEDRLSAYMLIHEWDEDDELTAEQLEQFLTAKGVVFGVLDDALKDAAAHPLKYVGMRLEVARGIEPVPGTDGSLRYLFDTNQDGEIRPQQMEDGTVNYREIRRLNNVLKGQPIVERVPPSPGTPGTAVTGETIVPRNGKEAHVKLGKNVVADPETQTIYAAIDGLVTFTDGDKINVFPVYEVNGDVDFHVGNIDFVGNVVIRGNVLPGFRVKAAGDIRVIGGVEAAELEAGGSVEITNGILGQGKGLVKAGKNVSSSFMLEANVEAAGDVIVSQSIMHSQIRAGKNVVCTGNKGLIVGGVIQAGEKVTAVTVGNTTSTPTAIEVGVLPELRNELNHLRERLKDVKTNAEKTEKALQLLDQAAAAGQLSRDKLAMRIRLNSTRKAAEEEIAQIRQRIMEIEKALEDTSRAEVSILSHVYPGTRITIGRYVRYVKDILKAARFTIADGEITIQSVYGGGARS
jgi:Predicted polymerase, most proteins contain PALM domain, HD hydrolase domain and Zn-ribbon domain